MLQNRDKSRQIETNRAPTLFTKCNFAFDFKTSININ